jgi:chemotaxis protein methyltransferase CheR
MQDRLVNDPLYSRLKEHLVESTGLAYYADKDDDLARRVGRRLASVGAQDCASYLEMLRDPLRGPPELDFLIAEITIGETHFFRHMEHFAALRELVLPGLIDRNQAHRRLRIWCAGCADGAEPYSLSILLKRDMGYRLMGWDVSILGTDINRHGLAFARNGRYEEWSLRGTSEDLRRNCFQKEGKHWCISPQFKEGVSYQYHNLVEHPFPLLPSNLSSFDLIVCRNVMIYFASDVMHRLVRQFHDCLVPGGWLLVGPSEPNMSYFTSFRAVNAPGVTLYQKPDHLGPEVRTEVPGMPWLLSPLPEPEPGLSAPPVIRMAVETPVAAPTLADVRRYVDQGDLEDAVRCCELLLEKENLNPTLHLYHALVLKQMTRHAEAERSLRQAIYLDRRSVLAHYYLGVLLQSSGDPRQAARCFENTVALLCSRKDNEVLADADGITVVELKKLTKMQIEILSEKV